MNSHTNCDWGHVSEEDVASNVIGPLNGDRLLSAYRGSRGTEFWIITEVNRISTTSLLLGEY